MSIKEIKDSIWEKLHDKIQQQKPEIKDKRYFVLQNILSMVGGLVFLLIILFLFSFIFIFLLEFILKKYQIIYRRPLVYSLGIFLALTFICGIVIARTSWHDSLLEQARTRHLPVLGGMYRNFDEPKDLHVGKLKEKLESVWTMQSRRGDLKYIVVSQNTSFPQGDIFVVGDLLFVTGQMNSGGQIEAWGIMPFQPRPFDRGFPKQLPMMK